MHTLSIKIDCETICKALRVSWAQAHMGILSWSDVMHQIDAMQSMLVYSAGEENTLDSDVMDDTKTLWAVALRNIVNV